MIILFFCSNEDVTPYVPDVDEEDFGDLEESEEGQSPIRKSTNPPVPGWIPHEEKYQGGFPR